MPSPSPSHHPEAYPRRILLAVAANSPQIITETLYALSQHTTPACVPTEVHVITTLRGLDFVRGLLPDQQDHLGRLCRDYALPAPLFSTDTIHLIEDDAGKPLDDVRTRTDNVYAADYISNKVRELTADPHSSLIVSLSGGRRTMTFYVGYALSLFGRPQDRLTHVLVSEEYYFHEEFYYPPPRPVWVMRDDDSGFDTSEVEVTLADIPFVRLRGGIPDDLLSGRVGFNAAIQAAQQEFSPVSVVLSETGELSCGGVVVTMRPVELAFYVWFLVRRVERKPPVRWSDDSLATELLAIYSGLYGECSGGYERIAVALNDGMTKEYFESRKSRTNTALKKVLGKQVAQRYLIDSFGKRPETRFGLGLNRAAIQGV